MICKRARIVRIAMNLCLCRGTCQYMSEKLNDHERENTDVVIGCRLLLLL
jgi:hypothetical protein